MARLLVAAIVSLTPASGFAGEEFESADHAVMLTPGEIDNSQSGLTIVHSAEQEGVTDWRAGFDQPADNTLIFSLTAEGAQHLNLIGGDQIALIHGEIRSGADDTILFAAPNGIYIGSTAIIDVGSFVAVAADMTDVDSIGAGGLPLTGEIVTAPGSLIRAEEDVLLYGTDVLLAGEVYTPGGRLLAVGADSIRFLDVDTITEGLTNPMDLVALTGNGGVQNLGELTAESAALIGRRVVNTGHIEIQDGTLMMLGGDAVRLVEFGNPVVVEITRANRPDNHVEAPEYAVENRGTIDAGRGRVQLAAADPLGWGIRQIAEPGGETPSIRAGTIELAGGENGRVEIAGVLDASDRSEGGVGGAIDVTGETIVLRGDVRDDAGHVLATGARLDASGDAGGGSIRVGGDELGKGDLQRARGVVVAEDAEVRADATTRGDGGRVIFFAESLTHIAGDVSARGGALGGDGGFVETSGLERLSLETTPDLSAPEGEGGHWLIDPYSIQIVDEATALDCPPPADACLNKAVEAILDPNFDSAGFDDILRTIDPASAGLGGADPNVVSVDLIVRALSVGTDVTLSTEAFDPNIDSPTEEAGVAGDIDVEAAILIPDGGAAPGTRATLTLLAAGSINVNFDISVGSGSDAVTPDMSLGLVLTANDQAQRDPNADFAEDQIRGDVNINANIRTGGGDFAARGIRVVQTAGPMDDRTIRTDGGSVFIQSGSIDRFGTLGEYAASANPDTPDPASFAPSISTGILLEGTIDTARPADDGDIGGAITLDAGSVNVRRSLSPTQLYIEAGELDVSGTLRSGGGAMSLRAGFEGTTSIGNARFTDATIESGGGNVSVEANRLDPDDTQLVSIDPVFGASADREGGAIVFAGDNTLTTEGGVLTIGHSRTQGIQLEGVFDTTGGDDGEDGLLAVNAGDLSGFDPTQERFGNGSITVGGTTTTTRLESAGISLEAREITTDTTGGAVALIARDESRQSITFENVGAQGDGNEAGDDFVTAGTIRLEAERRATFAANTSFEADTFDLTVATDPTALTTMERDETDRDLRLSFGGVGSAIDTAGVRIKADAVSIQTAPLFAVPTDVSDTPDEDTELARNAGANYAGLQLRSRDGSARPEAVAIVQAAGLTVVDAPTTTDNEIFFGGRSGGAGSGGVFDAASIGAEGQRIALTSESGTLSIGDAAGLNDDLGRTPGADAGASWITLNGGLLLGATPSAPAVDFTGITNRFDVASLSITSPRSLTIDTTVADAILEADALAFTAGRQTGLEEIGFDVTQLGGTLDVQAGLTLAATDSLSLLAGASGLGDLAFDATGAPIRLESNAIELRAGAGRDTRGLDPADRSEILGAASVEYRDGTGSAFVADGTPKSFSFRQDAAIDAATHLPTIDDFGITVGNGFGVDDERVDYSLRSDFGAVDLTTGGFDAAQVRDVDISLIGRETGTPAIQVPDGFVFDGRSVTLGGTTSFTYTTALADAFAPAGTAAAADKELTLRAASEELGNLLFESGVVVRAPHLRFVAGDGEGGDFGSRVIFGGATFDLTDGLGGDRSFVFQEDETFFASDLPTADRFVESGGAPVLPSILVVRNDAGPIDWINPDFGALPLDLSDALNPGRLVLEAQQITLSVTGTQDLVLTSDDPGSVVSNLRLRLRTDDLAFGATGGFDGSTGRVFAGEQPSDTSGPIGPGDDATFDDERLLIEGFQVDVDATTTNLSALSEVEGTPGTFDLATGVGPTAITVNSDDGISAADLFERFNVSGHLGRGAEDDAFGNPDPTDLFLFSTFGDISFAPENVSGSDLEVGSPFEPVTGNVTFGTGTYTFGSLDVVSALDITLESDTDITAESISLEAGFLAFQPLVAIDEAMGRLVFDGTGGRLSELAARTITLRAGPTFRVTNPDADGDGEGDPIPDGLLSEMILDGLASLDITLGTGSTGLTISSQSALDTTEILDALPTSGARFGRVELASIQSATTVGEGGLAILANAADALVLGSDEQDATLSITAGPATDAAPFSIAAGFDGPVELRSNDITINATGAPQLQLDDPNLRIVSRALRNDLDSLVDLARIASDPDSLERTRFTLIQDDDFATTTLPRLDRYFRRGFAIGSNVLDTDRRESLRFVEIELQTTATGMTFTDALRNGTIGSNLTLALSNVAGGTLDLALTDFRPGVADYEFESLDTVSNANNPALELASFEVTGFDEIVVPDFAPTRASDDPGGTTADSIDFAVETTGDQLWGGNVRLGGVLDAVGRDLTFAGDVFRDTGAPIGVGLAIQTRGEVRFEDDLGVDDNGLPPGSTTDGDTPTERLGFLHVLFDDDADGVVQFGRRTDDDADGIAETPVDEDQFVFVDGETVFASLALGEPSDPTEPNDEDPAGDFRAAIAVATNLSEIKGEFDRFGVGRVANSPVATIGKGAGNLTFRSTSGGAFVMGSGERLAVGGDLRIDHAGQPVTLGDVAAGGANGITVIADEIGLVRRNAGVTFLPDGASTQDAGGVILANVLDFGGLTPTQLGTGKDTGFAFPDPFDPTLPAFLSGFGVAAISADGTGLDASDFRFLASGLLDQVAAPIPVGGSRSELTGAIPPLERARARSTWRDLVPLQNPERMAELGVDARETPAETLVARLEGGAILDDTRLITTSGNVPVTESRLNPADAEAAIALYESLFGSEGQRAPEVQAVLQDALDLYRTQTRARRIVGFELRRFVKNRPSTLLEAYSTLDQLDALFRYHRRLGLSRGEFRAIQREWLEAIQPEGITLDELSEAIHPSRYVRGSDILDIFGR